MLRRNRTRSITDMLLYTDHILGLFLQVLRDLDQLLQHLDRVNAAVVVARDGLLQPRRELFLLDNVCAGAGADLAVPNAPNRNAARRLRSDVVLYRTC